MSIIIFTISVILMYKILYNITVQYTKGEMLVKYELSENLKKLRTQKHLTQTQLAKRLGVAISTIASYYNQDRLPSIEMLIKLSYEFNVTIEYLLGVNKNKTLDVSDLTEEQIFALNAIIEQFRKN